MKETSKIKTADKQADSKNTNANTSQRNQKSQRNQSSQKNEK